MTAPFSLGRTWDDVTHLVRTNMGLLAPVAGMFFLLPLLTVEYMVPAMALPEGREATLADLQAMLTPLAAAMPFMLFGQLLVAILLLAPGRPTLREAMQAALHRYFPMLFMSLLSGMMIVGGLMLFVLPGLYMAGRLFIATPVLAAEGSGPVASLQTCFRRTRGHGVKLLLLFTGIYVTVLIAMMAVSVAGGSILLLLGRMMGAEAVGVALAAVLSTATNAAGTLVMIVAQIAAYRRLN